MGLLDEALAFIDARKRYVANTGRDIAADPMQGLGLLGSRIADTLKSNVGAQLNNADMAGSVMPQVQQQGIGNMAQGLLGAGMTVYHGSPHVFDKFDMSKIGTGEGAQAYGHGLYFAEAPAVAKEYQQALKWRGADWNDPQVAAANVLESPVANGNRAKAAQHLEYARDQQKKVWPDRVNKPLDDAISLLRSDAPITGSSANAGAFYKVDIPDSAIDKMLHWDKPLSEQPQSVRDALTSLGEKLPDSKLRTGASAYGLAASRLGGADQAAAALKQAGIPGIKYLDQGSRNPGFSSLTPAALDSRIASLQADIATGGGNQSAMARQLAGLQNERANYSKQTHNYVLFDDSLANILGRE